MMKRSLSFFLLLLAGATTLLAGPLPFDFKDPKGVNNVVFQLDAPLEAINGSASGITGTVAFDPEHPGATHGQIVVASASLHVPNPMMKQHLHSAQWLAVEEHPEITFEAKSLKNVKTEGNTTTADAVGTFRLKGVAKDMTIPVTLTYLKDKLQARVPKLQGDLLVVRSRFQIQRSDFNIMAGKNEDKVADTIQLTLSLAGAAAR